MPKIKHDGKGGLKDHDGGPIRAGESVYSESLWQSRVKKMAGPDIDVEKDSAKKLEKKEQKFKAKLGIKADARKKPEKPDTPEKPKKEAKK